MSHTNSSPTDAGARDLAVLFLDRVKASPNKEAFRYLVNGDWVTVTWEETHSRVEALAAGLLALGIEPEQRVGIASNTRYEWIVADLAVMCAGAATTTVYPSTHADDTAYILADSDCRIVFAEDDSQVEKLTAKRGDLPNIQKVVVFDASADSAAGDDWIITIDDLAELGTKHLRDHPSCVWKAAEEIPPERLATLIYTSGTTGKPKGVRLSHRAWVYQATTLAEMGFIGEDDLQLLWLPLAHSFGKVLIAAQLACGFASAVDGRVDKIVENMAAVKPTFMAAAPRIFEKAHAKIATTTASQGGLKAKLFERAFKVGVEADRRQFAGKSVQAWMRLQRAMFDRLVFGKVRQVFGGRIKFFVSGSAPLNREIGEWFHAAGLLILEGYGLTESAGGGFVNRPDNYKLGTVGIPFEGTSVRISDDGEVQMQGPCVMEGYHNLPDKTAEMFTDDGWLRSEDRGTIDDDGFVSITGRIKELFKTSGGKYVAPPAIEAQFMALCPYASQFLVFGEGRNFVVALITLDPESITTWAKENGLGGKSYEELAKSPEVEKMIGEHVDRLNGQLNRWETIKKWAILDHDLSQERDELTPSLKVKRNVVAEHNKELLDSFYS